MRAIYEGWAHGEFRAGVDLYDPDVVLVQGSGFPESGTYLGLEGIAQYMQTFLEAWERVTLEAEDLTGAGDRVVVAVVQRGAGKGSGATTEFRYFFVWTFRDGKVIQIENFRERSEARAAAGLAD